jgi:hypothetical protein
VTAFGKSPNANGESYLFYENRSRVDGLNGLFGKLKREVIENQAVDNLTTILEKSKASLMARVTDQPETAVTAINTESNWKRRINAVTQASLLILLISAFVGLLLLVKFNLKGAKPSVELSKKNRLRPHRPPVM